MDEENQLVPVPETQALTETEAETNTLAPVALNELSTKLVAALDMIAANIPDLRKPHPSTAKKVRGARTVSREAVVSIVAMVEASTTLQRLAVMDTERAHEVMQSRDDFHVLAERIEILRAQVNYTIEARWAEVVKQAMRAFRIACGLVRDPEEGELAAHLAAIRHHLGRRNAATGKKRKDEAKR